jgi:coenzyme F420 hydrogenase subunit beta
LAQSEDKDTLRRGQDGGAVTALLVHALRSGLAEGVALSGLAEEEPLLPSPKLATTEEEVLENAGTRYAYCPNMLAFQEGVSQKKQSLAFVGTPCQIHALRKVQMFPLKKYSNPLQFCIGLMCTESFTYDGFFEEFLQRRMNIRLRDVEKMNIKGKVLIQLKGGETVAVPLSEAKQYTRSGCRLCNDFSAELADISMGGLGLSGWTFVILRTAQGEKVFNSAFEAGLLRTRAVDEEPFARKLLTKLTRKKRQNSPRNEP